MDSLERKRNRNSRPSLKQRLVQRYRFSIINDDELRETFSVVISKLGVIVFSIASIVITGTLAILLYRYSPLHMRENNNLYEQRQKLMNNILRLDSLEEVVMLRDTYIDNIRNVLLGKINADSLHMIDTVMGVENVLIADKSETEQQFVEQFEEQERYNITSQSPMVSDVQNRSLFRPTTGMVTEPFDIDKKHYGVDIAANPNESVVSVMDGTVVLSSYTAENGYVLCVYHAGDMMSVYKYCSSLLKKEGDKVKAGDVVALVGTTSSNYSSSHLHFELWYEGQALDPQKYIVF